MAEQSFVNSPKTGKKIMVGGPAWKSLVASGIAVHTLPVIERKKIRPVAHKKGGPMDRIDAILSMDVFQSPELANESVLATAPWKQRKYAELTRNKNNGRGSRTRSWSLEAPQKGHQRHELFDKCGQKCFLGNGESFPICPSCELYAGDCECRISCKGAEAALIRAREWKYDDIAIAAQHILDKKCRKTTPQTGGRYR